MTGPKPADDLSREILEEYVSKQLVLPELYGSPTMLIRRTRAPAFLAGLLVAGCGEAATEPEPEVIVLPPPSQRSRSVFSN